MIECQPEETEILESNTRAHCGSSLPLNELLRDQKVLWEMRRLENCPALQGLLEAPDTSHATRLWP